MFPIRLTSSAFERSLMPTRLCCGTESLDLDPDNCSLCCDKVGHSEPQPHGVFIFWPAKVSLDRHVQFEDVPLRLASCVIPSSLPRSPHPPFVFYAVHFFDLAALSNIPMMVPTH